MSSIYMSSSPILFNFVLKILVLKFVLLNISSGNLLKKSNTLSAMYRKIFAYMIIHTPFLNSKLVTHDLVLFSSTKSSDVLCL